MEKIGIKNIHRQVMHCKIAMFLSLQKQIEQANDNRQKLKLMSEKSIIELMLLEFLENLIIYQNLQKAKQRIADLQIAKQQSFNAKYSHLIKQDEIDLQNEVAGLENDLYFFQKDCLQYYLDKIKSDVALQMDIDKLSGHLRYSLERKKRLEKNLSNKLNFVIA